MVQMTTAYLEWSLHVECPNCEETFDLVDQDHESRIANRIFNNAWDKLEGYEVECPHCQHEFQIEKVEY